MPTHGYCERWSVLNCHMTQSTLNELWFIYKSFSSNIAKVVPPLGSDFTIINIMSQQLHCKWYNGYRGSLFDLATFRIQFSTDSNLFRCWVRQSDTIVLRNFFGISFLIEVLTGLVCWNGCQGISVLHHSSVDNDSCDFWDYFKFGLIFLNCEYMRSLLYSSNQITFMISFVESVTFEVMSP